MNPYRKNLLSPGKLEEPRLLSRDARLRLWLYPLLVALVIGFYYWLGSVS